MASNDVPEGLVEGTSLPAGFGFVKEGWFTEEHAGAARLGVKVQRELHREASQYQSIGVYETGFLGKVLTLDDAIMLTERDEFVYHEMLVHPALCSIPNPKRVLIIGGGDCGCLREALKHPCVEQVVQCDIDERVTRVSEEHFDWVKPAVADPRSELIFDDGVKYIEAHANSFDAVMVDSTDPKGPAVGLFLRDFYRKVAAALKPGGVLTAQTESPLWDAGAVGAIFGELRSAFSNVTAYVGGVPTYPSGTWSWAYASEDRTPSTFFDADRAQLLEETTKYYNRAVHQGAFALPNYVRAAVEGINPFRHFDDVHREMLAHSGSARS